jgi:hypothetical protein
MMRDLLHLVGLKFAVRDGAEHHANFAAFRHPTVAFPGSQGRLDQ